MQAELSPEVLPQAAAALVAHLRQHPEQARSAPGDLARQFGLSPEFVKSVLDGLQPPEQETSAPRARKITFDGFVNLWARIVALFDRAITRPTLFVTVTMILCIVVGFAISAIPEPPKIEGSGFRLQIDDALMVVAILGTLALHLLCYFRRKMARFALYGALVVWVVTATLVMIGLWLSEAKEPVATRFTLVMTGAMGMFFLALVYAGAGSLAAVAGGWLDMKLREREQANMSRQDMLERYFELQARLQRGGTTALQMPWSDVEMVQRFQQRPYLWSALLSILINAASVLVLGALGFGSREGATNPANIVLAMIGILTAFASFLSWVAVGFFAGKVGRAVLCGIIFSLAGILPSFIPVGQYGPGYVFSTRQLFAMGFSIPLTMLVSGIAGLGAVVHQRALREKSLQSNDQAAIIAEMLRIQWRLADHMSNVCVLVVDAAKSSVMKAEADPLAVEYSFREYQEWLEAIAKQYGGRVHSTAGDGAVISFETCDDALLSAKEIQKDLGRFNREQNRLKSPFRLRIGLHVGQVAGDIDEVQFTEVIDIAAHVQDVAPISGIAVTDDVAACLPTQTFLPLTVEVDGHKVLLALDGAAA